MATALLAEENEKKKAVIPALLAEENEKKKAVIPSFQTETDILTGA